MAMLGEVGWINPAWRCRPTWKSHQPKKLPWRYWTKMILFNWTCYIWISETYYPQKMTVEWGFTDEHSHMVYMSLEISGWAGWIMCPDPAHEPCMWGPCGWSRKSVNTSFRTPIPTSICLNKCIFIYSFCSVWRLWRNKKELLVVNHKKILTNFGTDNVNMLFILWNLKVCYKPFAVLAWPNSARVAHNQHDSVFEARSSSS